MELAELFFLITLNTKEKSEEELDMEMEN